MKMMMKCKMQDQRNFFLLENETRKIQNQLRILPDDYYTVSAEYTSRVLLSYTLRTNSKQQKLIMTHLFLLN